MMSIFPNCFGFGFDAGDLFHRNQQLAQLIKLQPTLLPFTGVQQFIKSIACSDAEIKDNVFSAKKARDWESQQS